MTVRKRFTFEASHNLPNYKGKCHFVHGHSWILWVEIAGEVNPETGMILDFTDLKQIVNELIIDKFDHSHLNDIIPNPTAENLTMLIRRTLEPAFDKLGLVLFSLRLAETEGNEVGF
jgi:6-pyruvoyltetrahydropterin/6-carboxytetrahydropterin synthase